MTITTTSFGTTSKGEKATLYTLTNENGFILEVTDFGASLVSAKVPTPSGLVDTLLGYDDVTGFEINKGHLGAIVGRHANRLAGACCILDGTKYQITIWDREASLHFYRYCKEN